MHPPELLPKQPLSWRMVIRSLVKALGLFLIFNVIYGVIDPVHTGQLPTLFNTLLPGRTRFTQYNEYDPYRMIDDHIISAAQPDTYNIVILGSSEMWGAGTLADRTIPAKLDQMGLVAADGRPVRVYNLAHPSAYAFRDLILLDVVLQKKIPVDLVILSTLDASLSLKFMEHPVTSINFSLSASVIDRYNVPGAYALLEAGGLNTGTPLIFRQWRDRDALMTWLNAQAEGLRWSLTRIDFDIFWDEYQPRPGLNRLKPILDFNRIDPPPSADFLFAFKRLSDQTGIPVIILGSPVPFEKNEFAPWLEMQTQFIGLPLIDCWDIFRRPSDFEQFVHIQPWLHDFYSQILAGHLSDAAFMSTDGLPLRTPPGFVPPAEACTLFPVTA